MRKNTLTKLCRVVVHVVAWMVRWQQRTNASPNLETSLGTGEVVEIFMAIYFLFDVLGNAHGWRQPHGCSPVMRRSQPAVDACG